MATKPLKIWNGRIFIHTEQMHVYVAAYSKKQAIELMNSIDGVFPISNGEMKTYFSAGCWGTTMNGITPEEPCVYVTDPGYDKNPKRLK